MMIMAIGYHKEQSSKKKNIKNHCRYQLEVSCQTHGFCIGNIFPGFPVKDTAMDMLFGHLLTGA